MTPQEQLNAMVEAYTRQDPGAGAALAQIIASSPEANDLLLRAIEAGELEHLTPLTRETQPDAFAAAAKGFYLSGEKTIYLNPADLLQDDPRKRMEALATLAHEADHAVHAEEIRRAVETATDAVREQATAPSPRDYTDEALGYVDALRDQELKAEFTAVNTVAAYVRRENPDATLYDLYQANPDTMRYFLDVDENARTATPKAGLVFDEQLRLAPTEQNLAAATEHRFLEHRAWPWAYGQEILEWISQYEHDQASARRENGSEVPPLLTADFSEIFPKGAPPDPSNPEALVDPTLWRQGKNADGDFPLPFFDPGSAQLPMPPEDRPAGISQFRRDPDPVSARDIEAIPAAASPATPGHPDHDYFRLLRERLPAGMPDTTVADAMLAAKQSGMTRPDQVDPAQIGVFGGTIWIGGQVPGYRASLDVDQARTDMRDIARDLAREETPRAIERQASATVEVSEAAVARGR